MYAHRLTSVTVSVCPYGTQECTVGGSSPCIGGRETAYTRLVCGHRGPLSRGYTALHASAQAQVWLFQPAIATDDLAASSCFQKRLRQLVNLSEKGKRGAGKKSRGGPRTQAACTFHTASARGGVAIAQQAGFARVAVGFEPQPRSSC